MGRDGDATRADGAPCGRVERKDDAPPEVRRRQEERYRELMPAAEGEPLQVLVCVGRVVRALEDGHVGVAVEAGPGPWAGHVLRAEADRDYPVGQAVALEVATRVVVEDEEGTERRRLTPVRARVTVDVDVEQGGAIASDAEIVVNGETVGHGTAGMLAGLQRMVGGGLFRDAVALAASRDPDLRRGLEEAVGILGSPPAPAADEPGLTPEDFAGVPSAVSAPVLMLAMRHAHIEGWKQARGWRVRVCQADVPDEPVGWMPLRSWTRFAEQNPGVVEAPTDGWWYCEFVETDRVRVPVSTRGRDLEGVVEGEEVDERVGKVFLVRFPSGHASRLTPAEVEPAPNRWLGAVVTYGAGDARMLQTLASVGLNPGGQVNVVPLPREPAESLRGRVLTAEDVTAWKSVDDREAAGL